MPIAKLKEFLNRNGVQEIASMAHIKGQDLAKTVIVKIDGQMAMAVLPASYQVDLSLLKAAARANTVTLATEAEFHGRFPECETGGRAPPTGSKLRTSEAIDSMCQTMRLGPI
jgi:Ala-tRNA(Pro) deacylase